MEKGTDFQKILKVAEKQKFSRQSNLPPLGAAKQVLWLAV